MKNKLFTIFALFAAITLTVACDDSTGDTGGNTDVTDSTNDTDGSDNCAEDCGGYICDAGTCATSCIDDLDCASGYTCDDNDECVASATYTKVLIVSAVAAGQEGGFNPGPDIDAVKITDGTEFFAFSATGQAGSYPVAGTAEATTVDDPGAATGESDAIDTTGGECMARDGEIDLVFSLGNGDPAATYDNGNDIGYILLSKFQDADGNALPEWDVSTGSLATMTVYELNNLEDQTPALCTNFDQKENESFKVYVADQNVVVDDFTNSDGAADLDKIDALVNGAEKKLISYGTLDTTGQINAVE